MRNVWIAGDCVVSPLGSTSEENYINIRDGKTGISVVNDERLSAVPVSMARMKNLSVPDDVTSFEYICRLAGETALTKVKVNPGKTLFILSTTKGNISLLESGRQDHPGIHLHASARNLANRFGFQNYFVVSNACISGVMALIMAKRFIESMQYDHVLVLGADVLSKFIVSGFQSLAALSHELCRPFDEGRQGINLGEAAAAIVLTAKPDELGITPKIRIAGGAVSNDANHISGPSRTGEELAMAIQRSLREAGLSAREMDFVSAHGTATLYNDEMEAKAFYRVGLGETPVHSLKGNFGHTLGAAGTVETVMSTHSLINDEVLPTKGFTALGVSPQINVSNLLQRKSLRACVKTASGFGGCNASIVLQKENFIL